MSLKSRLLVLWYWVDLHRPTKRDLLWALIGFDLWGLAVIATVGAVILVDVPTGTAGHRGMQQAASNGHGGVPVAYLTVLFAAAIYEELIFRNGIQKLLTVKVPAWTAIGVTSLFFTSLHLGAYSVDGRLTMPVLLSLFVIFGGSVSIGYAYYRTNNIAVAMLIHAAINFVGWLSTWA